jgi:hypothetical protein
MRKLVMPFVLSVGLVVIWAAPADAAATRAEYVAQLDPGCQPAQRAENKAAAKLDARLKRFNHVVQSGGLISTGEHLLREAAEALRTYNNLTVAQTSRIEAVPPPPEDSETVGLWIFKRKNSVRYSNYAVRALRHYKAGKYNDLIDQSNDIWASGVELVSGFGFKYCPHV